MNAGRHAVFWVVFVREKQLYVHNWFAVIFVLRGKASRKPVKDVVVE